MKKTFEDLSLLSAVETLSLYKSLEISPVDVWNSIKKKLSNYDTFKKMNALTYLQDFDVIEKEVKESEIRYLNQQNSCRPLDGIFVTIKDLISVKGWKTYYGVFDDKSVDMEEISTDQIDHPCVKRLREAGAIIIGKTTTPSFGWKGVTDSPLYGPTGNPHNPVFTSGGSSGGAAAAVQLGYCHISIGTDGGGSVRIPASFCGVSTIKPTHSLVAHSLSKFGTLSTIGPICRNIQDCALTLDVIGKQDFDDWYSIRPENPLPLQYLKSSLEVSILGNLRIAFSVDLEGHCQVHPSIKERFLQVISQVKESFGFSCVESTLPNELFQLPLREAFDCIWYCGCANTLISNHLMDARTGEELKKNILKMDQGLLEASRKGLKYSGVDLMKAENDRFRAGVAFTKFFQNYDILLTPTMPLLPFHINEDVPTLNDDEGGNPYVFYKGDQKSWPSWTPFTWIFNLTKNPAVSISMGLDKVSKLPMGLQIIGGLYQERTLLAFANLLEKRLL